GMLSFLSAQQVSRPSSRTRLKRNGFTGSSTRKIPTISPRLNLLERIDGYTEFGSSTMNFSRTNETLLPEFATRTNLSTYSSFRSRSRCCLLTMVGSCKSRRGQGEDHPPNTGGEQPLFLWLTPLPVS